MNKRILITGGAGFVGNVVVKEFLLKGYAVKVFDKLIFDGELLKKFKSRIELIQGDIRNFDENILNDVSSVIHLAGFSNDPMAEYSPEINNQINTLGTKRIAEACARKGINRFVYASTASIYDGGVSGNIKLQDENSEVTPRAAYSISKYNAERELLKIMKEYPNFCPVILRKGTIFGYSPRMRFDLVVNTFVKEAFLNKKLVAFCRGAQWRPLVDVNDVARAYVACIEAEEEKVKGQIFNIVQSNYQIMDVAHRVKYALKGFVNDIDVEIDYGEDKIDRSYKILGKKIEEVLGFRYHISIEDSVKKIAEKIKEGEFLDLRNPLYYNIRWIEFLIEIEKKLKEMGGSVF
jgi:nucleoside-diphosphate-sugar epimerase